MKKTLIALAVAASAAVSGSAMAWTANGTSGSVELGGTIVPAAIVTPWETKIGDGVADLNSQIASGQTEVSIQLPNDLLVLGVRSTYNFPGGLAGVVPQLDFGDAVDLSSYSLGNANLSLVVKNDADERIGVLSTKIATGAEVSRIEDDTYTTLIAGRAGQAFWGGVPDSVAYVLNGYELANRIDPSIVEHYQRGTTQTAGGPADFSNTEKHFSSFYVAGLLTDNAVNISLDSAPVADVNWKAKLPVTVTYQ